MGRFIAAFVFASLSVARSAWGAVIVVSPAGPLSSIQAGVDAASAGDTVLVKAGIYEGVVAIPGGKQGLTIKAKGEVVVDARAPNGDPLGDAIEVGSNLVTLQGLTIRHAADDGNDAGNAIHGLAKGLTVIKCKVLHCSGAAIQLDPASALDVRDCVFEVVARGIVAPVVQGSVRDTTFRVIGSEALLITTIADFTIERCTFRSVRTNAVRVTAGNGITVEVRNCRFDQVFEFTARLLATGNARLVFETNKCSDVGSGVIVEGAGVADVSIRKNVFTRVSGGATGGDGAGVCIGFFGATSGEIANNRASFCSGGFVRLFESSQGVALHDNRSTDMLGTLKARPYVVAGTGITLENERVLRSAGDAFFINSLGATLDDCTAKQCADDGFEIRSDEVTLTSCVAIQCNGEGFQNDGKVTRLVDCVAKKNRIDIATQFAFELLDATFLSGGDGQLPEID